jgi:Xaa-Pro aminopeptidase
MRSRLGSGLLAAAAAAICLCPVLGREENVFAGRRNELRGKIHGQAVLYSGTPGAGGLDKNFYYLTGLDVGNAFLLMSSESEADKLFLDPADAPMPAEEMVRTSGISLLFGRGQVDAFLAAGLAEDLDVFFPDYYGAATDPAYLGPSSLAVIQLLAAYPQARMRSLNPVIIPMRMSKDSSEIGRLGQACDVTGLGLRAGMAALRPGMLESDLQGVIEGDFLARGAAGTSFASIVGSGPNSLILHYEKNNRRMEAGEVVVVDVGADVIQYAGDITRTLPVSGFFTARQRQVYEAVLECQRRVFAACRPGATLAGLNEAARGAAVERGFGDFFNFSGWRHSTCHHLGLDVHDTAYYGVPLSPGMVITVEPGIYLPGENLGVRIEDDVLITAGDCLILSESAPRAAADVEAAIAGILPPPSGDDSSRRLAVSPVLRLLSRPPVRRIHGGPVPWGGPGD